MGPVSLLSSHFSSSFCMSSLTQRQSQPGHAFRGNPLGNPDQPGQEPGAAVGATMSRNRTADGKRSFGPVREQG